MIKLAKKVISVTMALCLTCSVLPVCAADITPSETSITLGKNDTEISFDIYLETDEVFAGAEFGIKPSQSDVEFKSLTLSEELQNESKVQTVKDGCLYFGFFSNSNKYSAGKHKVATLNYSYSGSGARTISLTESKIVTVTDDNKTNGDTSSKPFTVTISKAGTSSGGSGGSGGGGGSSTNNNANKSSDKKENEDAKSEITIPDTSKTYNNVNFIDVEGHWAEKDIYECVKKELFSGVSDNSFEPDSTVTRAMAITVFGRFSKDIIENNENYFKDVLEDKYYANYVSWGAKNKIVEGISETEYAPEENVTREQISAMIMRYLKYKNVEIPACSEEIKEHNDYDEISDYAKDSMAVCYAMNLITGHDNGLIEPKGNLTRGQFASIMNRLDNYIENTFEK